MTDPSREDKYTSVNLKGNHSHPFRENMVVFIREAKAIRSKKIILMEEEVQGSIESAHRLLSYPNKP